MSADDRPRPRTGISPSLSEAQLEHLAMHGEEMTAEPGETLFDIGDETYPFVAIREGEVEIRDANDGQIAVHGDTKFLGEMNLLTGQTVYIKAVATKPTSYVAVPRKKLRKFLTEESALSELLLSTFIARREALQQVEGIGVEIIGPRSSERTRGLVEFVRRQRIPHTWRDPDHSDDDEAAELLADLAAEDIPLVRLPGGAELRGPSNGEASRRLGIGVQLDPEVEVDLLVVGGGPAGLGAAVYGASEGLDTLVAEGTVLGGQAGTSRRIENYLGFPGGISGSELTSRAVAQARKFGTQTATPYKALSLQPGDERHRVRLDDDVEVRARAVVLATGAQYRRLPVDSLEDFEGVSVFYSAGPLEGQRCAATRVGVVGGGNSAAQAAIWLAREGAIVTLLHRRADLSETMSDYLIRDLERFHVAVRDSSEIAELHGDDGELDAVTLRDGEQLPMRSLFLFLGAEPCTDWLGDVVARDEKGFVLTGPDAGVEELLATSVPGVYAAGDVRSGSIKRCATAVGEGAMVVQFVHSRLNAVAA